MYGRTNNNIFRTNNTSITNNTNNNIFSKNNTNTSSGYGSNNNSYNNNNNSYNNKFGSNRIPDYSSSNPPRYMQDINPKWRQSDLNPISIVCRKQAMHLLTTELRVEDYFLIRTGKLGRDQERLVRDAMEKNIMQSQLMSSKIVGNMKPPVTFSQSEPSIDVLKQMNKNRRVIGVDGYTGSNHMSNNNTSSYGNNNNNIFNRGISNNNNNTSSNNIFGRNSTTNTTNTNNNIFSSNNNSSSGSNNNNIFSNNNNNNKTNIFANNNNNNNNNSSGGNNIFSNANNTNNNNNNSIFNRNNNNSSSSGGNSGNNIFANNNNSSTTNSIFNRNNNNNTSNNIFSNNTSSGGNNNNTGSNNIFNRNNNNNNIFNNNNSNNNNSNGSRNIFNNNTNNNSSSNNNNNNIFSNSNYNNQQQQQQFYSSESYLARILQTQTLMLNSIMQEKKNNNNNGYNNNSYYNYKPLPNPYSDNVTGLLTGNNNTSGNKYNSYNNNNLPSFYQQQKSSLLLGYNNDINNSNNNNNNNDYFADQLLNLSPVKDQFDLRYHRKLNTNSNNGGGYNNNSNGINTNAIANTLQPVTIFRTRKDDLYNLHNDGDERRIQYQNRGYNNGNNNMSNNNNNNVGGNLFSANKNNNMNGNNMNSNNNIFSNNNNNMNNNNNNQHHFQSTASVYMQQSLLQQQNPNSNSNQLFPSHNTNKQQLFIPLQQSPFNIYSTSNKSLLNKSTNRGSKIFSNTNNNNNFNQNILYSCVLKFPQQKQKPNIIKERYQKIITLKSTISINQHIDSIIELYYKRSDKYNRFYHVKKVNIDSIEENQLQVNATMFLTKINLPDGYFFKPRHFEGFQVHGLEIANQYGSVRWLGKVNIRGVNFSKGFSIQSNEIICSIPQLDQQCIATFNCLPAEVNIMSETQARQTMEKFFELTSNGNIKLEAFFFNPPEYKIRIKRFPEIKSEN